MVPSRFSAVFTLRSRRAAWTVADQALSSLTNFAVTMLVLRTAPIDEFGAFAVVYSAYLFAVAISRALVLEPMMIRQAEGSLTTRQAQLAGIGGALLVGLAGSVLMLAAAAIVKPPARGLLGLVGAGLVLLMIQDAARYIYFSAQKPRLAFAIDGVWALVLAASFFVSIEGASAAAVVVGGWVVGGSAAGLAAIVQLKVLPKLSTGAAFVRSQAAIGLRFAAEYASSRGAVQFLVLALTVALGSADVGRLMGARSLLGAVNIAFIGASVFGIPEGTRTLHRSTRAFGRFVPGTAIVLSITALSIGAALIILPNNLGEALLGSNWLEVESLLFPLAVSVIAAGWRTGYTIGLRCLADARSSLRSSIVSALLTVVATMVGATLWGVSGAAWGMAAGMIAGATVWSLTFLASLSRRVLASA